MSTTPALVPGLGWGHAQRPDPNGRHLMFFVNTAQTSEIVVRDNIFAVATESCLWMDNDWRKSLLLDEELLVPAARHADQDAPGIVRHRSVRRVPENNGPGCPFGSGRPQVRERRPNTTFGLHRESAARAIDGSSAPVGSRKRLENN